MVGIKNSSYNEYKLENGLSCIEQFRNLGQNEACYYIVFDEWKDACALCMWWFWIRIHQWSERLYFGTQVGGGRGNNKFSVLLKGEAEHFKSSLGGTDVF